MDSGLRKPHFGDVVTTLLRAGLSDLQSVLRTESNHAKRQRSPRGTVKCLLTSLPLSQQVMEQKMCLERERMAGLGEAGSTKLISLLYGGTFQSL